MSTLKQRSITKKKNSVSRLQRIFFKSPQRRATVQRVFITTPKKPHSGKRKTAKVKLTTGFSVLLYLQGEDVKLQRYAQILVRPGRVRDLPGVKFKGVRGKYDFRVFKARTKQRSFLGLKKKKDQ